MIPARAGSRGIIKKNLKLLEKKPLVQHTIDFAKKLKFVDKIVVNSNDQKVIAISKKSKVDYIKRLKKLSGDIISDFELLYNTIDYYKKKNCFFDYLIYLQPTSPFRKLKDLYKASNKISDQNYETIWSVNKVSDKFHPFKLLEKKNKFIHLHSSKGVKIIARQQLNDIYQRNGIFYIFDIRSLLKNKSIYPKKGIFPYEINYNYVNIDTQKDLINCKKLFKTWSM